MIDDKTLTQRITHLLSTGSTPADVGATLALDVITEHGLTCVALPGYVARDESGAKAEYPSIESGDEAAEDYVHGGDWGDRDSTIWIRVSTWRVGLYVDEDGDVMEAQVDEESHTITLEAEEPECSEGEHDWASPYEVVGGCEESPGVWANEGGVVITKVCRHCGTYRVTDTWARSRETGERGLRSTEYRDADETSLAWVASLGEGGDQ